jgi:ubiquitin C-terminal hydrolase
MDAGHYWSISLRGENYYVFNDAKISKIEKVFHKSAYILIYQ